MAVRLDVGPLASRWRNEESEADTPTPRRNRLNLNLVKLSTRKKPVSLLFVEDPLALRYLCRA